MLLIDGVKYEEWTPEDEVRDYQPLIEGHFQEIFGPQMFHLKGNKLAGLSVPGAIPDWFLITFGKEPYWYIVEAELSKHPVYSHIVDQIGRFLAGVEDSRSGIFQSIYSALKQDPVRWAEITQAISSDHPHEFLTNVINMSPVLKIIIERQTDELNKALKFIGHSPNDVIEFKTFVREGIGLAVHAHLFEPLRGIRKGKGDTGGGEGKGKGRKYLLSTKELLRKHGHKQSNVPGKTWQQLYDTSDDGNFRYFKIRLPLIQLDQKETVKRTQ